MTRLLMGVAKGKVVLALEGGVVWVWWICLHTRGGMSFNFQRGTNIDRGGITSL